MKDTNGKRSDPFFLGPALQRLSAKIAPLVSAEIIGALERHLNDELLRQLPERVEAIIAPELPQLVEAVLTRELPHSVEAILARELPDRIEAIVNRLLPAMPSSGSQSNFGRSLHKRI
jgi:hypothetical protein